MTDKPSKRPLQGWECPRCGTINAPFASACDNCRPLPVVWHEGDGNEVGVLPMKPPPRCKWKTVMPGHKTREQP